MAIFINSLFLNKGFVSAQKVHAWGNQLVLELLLKPSNTLHIYNVDTLNFCMKKFDDKKVKFTQTKRT